MLGWLVALCTLAVWAVGYGLTFCAAWMAFAGADLISRAQRRLGKFSDLVMVIIIWLAGVSLLYAAWLLVTAIVSRWWLQ